MKQNLTQKLIRSHLVQGEMKPGAEIQIKIDQTLTQDALGTMAYLEFEAMGIPQVKTELSVSYVDHNTLQLGHENPDDHKFLQTIAAKYGISYSRPGNGICHQVHLERFGKPGKTLLGADSHTPTGGGMGMLAIGAGGMDVATAMAGMPFYLNMPKVVKVELTGQLEPGVSAKDIVLELLRQVSVKGGVGKVFEYTGAGVSTLSVTQRATITNMGAETGATSSVFPSDEQTFAFLRAQGREADFIELLPDEGATYEEELFIDLSTLNPLIALPHLPDRVVSVESLKGTAVDQVFIGSCTNSSYFDLVTAAKLLKGKTVHPNVSLSIAPGTKQVFTMLAKEGWLTDIISSGARILESACGPCAGSGGAPPTKGISLRTTNRNFEGRCGTLDAGVYLAGVETCIASALAGFITDAKELVIESPKLVPDRFEIEDNMIIAPQKEKVSVEVIRGPNIKPLPMFEPLADQITADVMLKLGDNISTDHIIPADARIIQLRSNIPELSKYTFSKVDPDFYGRITASGSGIIIAGHNYGQGSSREHAALAPKYLGVKVVIAKSFARIHKQNLINFGILPLTFVHEEDYNIVTQGDKLVFHKLHQSLKDNTIMLLNETAHSDCPLVHSLTERQVAIVLAGGLLKYVV